MDSIKFVFGEATPVEETNFSQYLINIILNGHTFSSLLNLSAVMALANFHYAEFDLFTCSCGEPGCAGFQSAVKQSISNGITTWKFPHSEAYTVANNKEYHFDQKEFETILKNTLSAIFELESTNIFHESRIDSDYDYSKDEENPTEIYIATPITKSIIYYTDLYQSEQNFRDTLINTNPDLIGKSFNLLYNGIIVDEFIPFEFLISKTLNQFPSKKYEPFYLAKCKLMAVAIKEFLDGNNTRFKQITNRCYKINGMSLYDMVGWHYNSQITKEIFDENKLTIKMVGD